MAAKFDTLSNQVIEAAIDVHRELGAGFLEAIYESALKVALRHRGILYDAQREIPVFYLGEELGMHRLDLVVENQLVVELKAVKGLEDIHYAQVRSYLKAAKLKIGLLMNFNSPTLVVKRIVPGYRSATQPDSAANT